ncbi:MAG: hypothetical protein VSS75_000340 [Candidatus Parabeggiatoa sp.]|nr:hypothetical protein [Candidatus Parabeggiatoa sp.]
MKIKSISLKNFKTFQSVELKVLTTYPFSIMLRFEANPHVSVFVETRCLASLFRGEPSLETLRDRVSTMETIPFPKYF